VKNYLGLEREENATRRKRGADKASHPKSLKRVGSKRSTIAKTLVNFAFSLVHPT
jgi:hypothetical protein